MIGFEALGWAAVFTFVTWYSIAEQTVIACAYNGLDVALQPVVYRVLQDAPHWAMGLVERGCVAALFSLPQLLFALLGGWLARRVGLTARFTLAPDRARES